MVGDAKEGLQALLPLLTRRTERAFLDGSQRGMAEWREKMAALENPEREPIAPQFLMATIDRAASNDAILTCDSGTIATWAARHWTIRGQREFYLSGNLGACPRNTPVEVPAWRG